MIIENKKRPIKKKRGKKKQNYFQYVPSAVAIIFIILIIGYKLNQKKTLEYENIKQYDDKRIIYTKYDNKKKTYSITIPYINIDSPNANSMNEQIDKYTKKYLSMKKSIVSYEYNINGDILSLVIKGCSYKDSTPIFSFKTYNINLKTKNIVPDNDLLSMFNIDEETIEKIIKKNFVNFYKDEIAKKYFDKSECSYNCFLKLRNVTNYMDNVEYYVEKGNLIAYKPFVVHSFYGEEDYYKDNNFKFLLVKVIN